MAALSSKSRYFRFFTLTAQLSDQSLRHFTAVDQQNHVAWIALDASDPRHPGLGVARFIRISKAPTVAEMAIAVIDTYQHRGLGTVLLAVLCLMAEVRGTQVLRAIVLPENTTVCNWLRALGAVESYEEGEYRLDLTVHRNPALLPKTPSGENFKGVIDKLKTGLRWGVDG
jgi:ribosomal protein S18 acetylase RimI-like enzyme